MVTSREVVKKAIHFECPERLPMRFASLGIDDTHSVPTNAVGTGDHSERETYDEWHCLWTRSEVNNMGQVKGHPLEDWDALEEYIWPDPDEPAYYAGMEERFDGAEDKYVVTGIFMLLFERMHALRGMTNVLTELHTDRGRMMNLADRIVDFDLTVIQNIGRRFPGRIDGFTFTDDWGTEEATFISPEMWCDFFQPRYAKIFAAAHAQGWDVWMHTCGKVNEIIEPLIEIGLDVINLQQPRALGIEEIGGRYAGRICFESLCDIQATLPFKGEQEIGEEARLLLEHWATPEGGFILSDYGDGEAIGVPLWKKNVMLDAFCTFDPYRTGEGEEVHIQEEMEK
ncbi:MAG: uroporphyrinogen decarboxylase family protein [Anaerolineae bacterium]